MEFPLQVRQADVRGVRLRFRRANKFVPSFDYRRRRKAILAHRDHRTFVLRKVERPKLESNVARRTASNRCFESDHPVSEQIPRFGYRSHLSDEVVEDRLLSRHRRPRAGCGHDFRELSRIASLTCCPGMLSVEVEFGASGLGLD